jgi:hypothetical protein
MALGGGDGQGVLHFTHITVPEAGTYIVRLLYVRNGLENKQVSLTINGVKQNVLALMRSWNWVDVPVNLQAGQNQITVSYKGEHSFYLDSLKLLRSSETKVP